MAALRGREANWGGESKFEAEVESCLAMNDEAPAGVEAVTLEQPCLAPGDDHQQAVQFSKATN